MDLADRIRRSLSPAGRRPPPPRSALIEQLRREMSRIQARAATPSRPAPRLRAGPAPGLPEPLDPEGQLFRQDFAPRHRFGEAALERPGAELLAMIERLLGWCAGWTGDHLRAEDLLFLDLETTGLSRSAETIPFLIGAGRWPIAGESAGAGGFRVDQIFLRDPADEALALDRLQQLLETTRVVVTFNGRGFDLPLLQNRSLITRTFLDLDRRPHLDLLPICRRLFRPRLVNCRLVTLERDLLGFTREGDVEGDQAPRIYNEWLRSGEPGELPLILEHNRLDVALMSPLLHRAARHLVDPLHWAEDAEELLGCALLHLRRKERGAPELAEACLIRGLELARRPATRRSLLVTLARHLRRSGRPHDASARWEQLRREFPDQTTGWIELAKYHEHVTRDLPRALELAERSPHQTDEVQQRLRRLRRRVQRSLERPR